MEQRLGSSSKDILAVRVTGGRNLTTLQRGSVDVSTEIAGWGSDLDPAIRPGVPRELGSESLYANIPAIARGDHHSQVDRARAAHAGVRHVVPALRAERQDARRGISPQRGQVPAMAHAHAREPRRRRGGCNRRSRAASRAERREGNGAAIGVALQPPGRAAQGSCGRGLRRGPRCVLATAPAKVAIASETAQEHARSRAFAASVREPQATA